MNALPLLNPARRQAIRIIGLPLLIICCLPFIHTFSGDAACWGNWSAYILHHGLAEAYNSGTNYLPVYQYVLWLYGLICGNEENIWRFLPFLRVFTLAFDLWGIWMLWSWTGKRLSLGFLLFFLLCNVAYSYNTLFWGQVDGIEASLIYASLYAISRKRLSSGAVLLILAINMKLQAVVFVPLAVLLCIPQLQDFRSARKLVYAVLLALATQLAILLPFSQGEGGMLNVWHVVTGSFSNVPKLSVNAYNFWYWTTSDYPGNVADDTVLFASLSAKTFGLCLFAVTSGIALLPVTRMAIRLRRSKGWYAAADSNTIWLTAALVCILFFYCNTEMHERYVHPAFIFIASYAVKNGRYLIYGLFSIAYLLNLEGAGQWLGLPNYGTVLFDGRLIAGVYAVIIVLLYVALYKRAPGSAIPAAS